MGKVDVGSRGRLIAGLRQFQRPFLDEHVEVAQPVQDFLLGSRDPRAHFLHGTGLVRISTIVILVIHARRVPNRFLAFHRGR